MREDEEDLEKDSSDSSVASKQTKEFLEFFTFQGNSEKDKKCQRELRQLQLTFGSPHVSSSGNHPRGTAPSTRASLECRLSQCERAVRLKLVRDDAGPAIDNPTIRN
jgi:hypothetical protein